MTQGIKRTRAEELNQLIAAWQQDFQGQDLHTAFPDTPAAIIDIAIHRFIDRKTIRQLAEEVHLSEYKVRRYCQKALYALRKKYAPEYFGRTKDQINKQDTLGANY